ncbi:hypothetical protein GIB67_010880 [Kingdonia uniflora]|uniref:Uncharacterized protein n=1 Tax=Kingdonia uniflora TaxID=39325 RepID=A0A7J7ND90_9MAGN|nr:hypothetical protein GIB67_010880 [Kingdonia uniflora]
MTQSNPNEQSVELNRTSLYWGYYSFLYLLFYFPIISSIKKRRIIHDHLIKCGGKWVNGRYYWKDSSLADRYCSWYSCDRFSRCFLLWFIFWIGFIPVVII